MMSLLYVFLLIYDIKKTRVVPARRFAVTFTRLCSRDDPLLAPAPGLTLITAWASLPKPAAAFGDPDVRAGPEGKQFNARLLGETKYMQRKKSFR